jgi:hypothetical protein
MFVSAGKNREEFCDELFGQVEKATGVQLEVAVRMVSQMASAHVWPAPKDQTDGFIQAITSLAEYAPRNVVEASLAAQLTATGEAALMFLRRATIPDQPVDFIDRNVMRATRLMHLHLNQIEAMQKLKGKTGQQTVTVEHVHVHEGGQAIVGAVTAPEKRRGVGDGKGNC